MDSQENKTQKDMYEETMDRIVRETSVLNEIP